MEIINIVDSSVSASLLYYQAKACEARITSETLYELLCEVTAEAIVEISDEYIAAK
jgi:hypothetical protein